MRGLIVLSLNNGYCPVPSSFAGDDSKLQCPYSILYRNDVKMFNAVLVEPLAVSKFGRHFYVL